MKCVISIIILAVSLSILGTSSSSALDKGISVVITGIHEAGTPEKPTCQYSYTIENNSYGTLNYILINGTGDGLLSNLFFLDNRKRLKVIPIAVGETFEGSLNDAMIKDKSKCSGVQFISVSTIDEAYCNIRMFPEGVKCSDHVSISSAVPGVSIKYPDTP